MPDGVFATLKGNGRKVHLTRQESSFELSCLVKGDSSVFDVKVSALMKVSALKELIHEKKDKGILRDVNASDLVLWKVRRPHGSHLGYTDLSRQPTVQIDCIPEATCLEHVGELHLSKDAIKLDGGYEVATIFPQFVPSETLEALKDRTKRPLTVAPEYDPETLGNKVLDKEHLHIIVQKPDIGEHIDCAY